MDNKNTYRPAPVVQRMMAKTRGLDPKECSVLISQENRLSSQQYLHLGNVGRSWGMGNFFAHRSLVQSISKG